MFLLAFTKVLHLAYVRFLHSPARRLLKFVLHVAFVALMVVGVPISIFIALVMGCSLRVYRRCFRRRRTNDENGEAIRRERLRNAIGVVLYPIKVVNDAWNELKAFCSSCLAYIH